MSPVNARGIYPLLIVLVLPAVLAGPGVLTSVLLQHEHDGLGQHAHVLSARAVHELHERQHGHDPHEGDGTQQDSIHDSIPPGTPLQVMTSPVLRPDRAPAALSVAQMLSWEASELPGHRVVNATAPPIARGDARPIRQQHASGAVRVLRSSGAFLI